MSEQHPWVTSILNADLSKRSKEQYERSINKLSDLAEGKPLETILAHPRAMKARIDRAYDNMQTRKALVSAVRAIFKYNPNVKEHYARQFQIWTEVAQETDKVILDRVASAQPTRRELINWVNWSDVIKKQQELSATEYGSLNHLVLSMYTLMEPMRADFGNLRIYIEGHEEPPPDTSDENYIILSGVQGQSKIVLSEYKTSRKYGRFQRPLPDDLVRIIIKSLELQPRHYVFVDDSLQPYIKKNSYTRFVNRILERLFQKRFTISLLRHSFISGIDFNESTPSQLIQYSKNMMHSLGMQQLYRRKIPEIQVVPVRGTQTQQPQRRDDRGGRIILL